MGKRLYVGNLSFGVDAEQLESLFAEYGQVEDTHVVRDRETGRSRGFGFVTMTNDSDAESAIQALNEQEHEGRTLRVNEARPREDRGPRGGGGGRY